MASLANLLPSSLLDLKTLFLLVPTTVVLIHLVNYVLDPHKIRRYPGPFLAKFTEVWFGRVAAEGHRSQVVHKLHQKYGASSSFFLSPTYSRIPWS